MRGAALCPLAYLIREHSEVTEEIAEIDFDTDDARLIATTLHSGEHFDIDNVTLYEELKPLVVDGPGWGFIKKFDKTKDGRGAVLALKAQAEGQSATFTRKSKAYATLASASYRGLRRGFTYDNYVRVHQDAHNELLELNEPVPESKKVTDFLRGIQDSALQNGKDFALGDPAKMATFEACQQYLGTLILNRGIQAKSERNVSSVHRNGQGGSTGNGSKALIDKVKGGNYTNAQWQDFSQAEKERIQSYRKSSPEAVNKRKQRNKERNKKRQAAKAKSERDNASDQGEDESEDDKTKANAGSQFGSNGSKRNKKS